jgi:hypothetical protein
MKNFLNNHYLKLIVGLLTIRILEPQASRRSEDNFSHRVIKRWNKIPASLKQAKNIKCFKNGY